MIALVEGAARQKTPNEIALNILLAVADDRLPGRGGRRCSRWRSSPGAEQTMIVLVALLVVPDPDHHRRAALRDRHRRHGPPGAAQRAGDVRPRRRGRRRRQHPAARQDRHHHPRQPSGRRVPAGRRRQPSTSWPTPRSSPRSPTRPPRAAPSWCSPRPSYGLRERARRASSTHATWVPFTAQTRMSRRRPRRGRRRAPVRKGAAGSVADLGHASTAARSPHDVGDLVDGDLRRRRHPAGRGRRGRHRARARPRRHPPQGRRQGRACASASTSCAGWASGPS